MPWTDMLTVPLKTAQDIATQPLQPHADPTAYADETDKATFEQRVPDFFRQAAAQIAAQQAQSQATQQAIEAQAAQADAAAAQPEVDTYQGPREKTIAGLQQLAAAQQNAPSPDLTPAAQTQGPEGIVTQAGGGLFGDLTDIAKAALSPVGHAIEKGVEKVGQGVENLPGGETVGTAIENLPRAAAKFKEVFGQEFQKKTGQRLNLESAYNAMLNSPGEEADEALAHTLDPLINNTIGTFSPKAAKYITGALDQAGAMAPYVLIGILAPPLEAPMAASFALQGVSGVKELTEQYRAGNIDGKTALLGIALNGSMVGAPFAGPMLSHIMPYFKSPAMAEAAVRDLEGILGKPGEVGQLERGVRAAEALHEGASPATKAAEAIRTSEPMTAEPAGMIGVSPELRNNPALLGLTNDATRTGVDQRLEQVLSERQAEAAPAPSPKTEPEMVTVYHGSGRPIEGDLREGSFVTTDRAAAERYAQVDGKIRTLSGETPEPTVHEFQVPREDLGEVPPDATTLGSPFVVKRALTDADRINAPAEGVKAGVNPEVPVAPVEAPAPAAVHEVTQHVLAGEPAATEAAPVAAPAEAAAPVAEAAAPAPARVSRAAAADTRRFFESGDTGAIDTSRVGRVVRDFVKNAGQSVARVVEYVKKIGRTFHNNELGALLAGKKKFENFGAEDVLNFGASRRWLHPEEDAGAWAREMVTRVGGTEEFWKSKLGDVRAHVERMWGLLGEGKQGVTDKGVRFGNEAGPTTLERLVSLANEGRLLQQKGNVIDMAKWYDNFWKTMVEHFGDDADVMTRIMAATQMNNAPAGGVPIALRAYLQWKMGEPISRMGSKVIREQIESFLMGGLPAGDKIEPFWEALRFTNSRGKNAVAVDRWVIGALGGKSLGPGMDVKNLQGNTAFIRFSQALVQSAADEVGMTPRGFQAAIWGGFRKEWDALLKAAGGRPMGGDNAFFEDLLLKKMKEYDLRSPSDFRLNSEKNVRAQLMDAYPGQAEVEFWQKGRAEAAAELLGTSPKNADAVMNDLMFAEWNKKIAAAHLLDTGEMPGHIRTPEVVDDVTRTAEMYRDRFRDRIAYADDATLNSLKDVPKWQAKEIAAELDRRTRTGEQAAARMEELPKAERERLSLLGWMRVPDDPMVASKVNASLAELDGITTEQELIRWMKRKENAAIVGDPQAFIGRSVKTGERYTMNGKSFEKTAASPYWEPRSFYENRLVLNVDRVKAELRKRFPTDPAYGRNGADTLGIRDKAAAGRDILGECGGAIADAAF